MRRRTAQKPPARAGTPVRGVSLIEAIVALAVMSFGMMALVGVQATMRYNSDVARQRTEAMRLAASDLERQKVFTTLGPVTVPPTPNTYAAVLNGQSTPTLPGATGNTVFTLNRNATELFDITGNDRRLSKATMKALNVRVDWTDRAGVGVNSSNSYDPSAVLRGVVSGTAPALSARLAMPNRAGPGSRFEREGRHGSIPTAAKDLGNGRSALKPFDLGGFAWVLNNTTGEVTSRCSVAVTQAAIALADVDNSQNNCTLFTVPGRLVSGTVRYDWRSTQPDAAAAESPQGDPSVPPTLLRLDASAPLVFATRDNHGATRTEDCMSGTPVNGAIPYLCVVYPDSADGWGGQLNVQIDAGTLPMDAITGLPSVTPQVCRYTTAASDFTANADHPKSYCRVKTASCTALVTTNLVHQNFLLIRDGRSGVSFSCPTDPQTPGVVDLVNSNTRPHQP